MTIAYSEIYGVFGLGEFGAASFGRGLPLKIAFSIPNGIILNTQVNGLLVENRVNGNILLR